MTKKLTLPEGGIFNIGNNESKVQSKSINNKKTKKTTKPINKIEKETKNDKIKVESSASETESTNASTQNEIEKKSESFQSASKFKIKKGSRSARRTTVTYRLNTTTIDGIEEVASSARKSINETVQELLDWALENVEIE